jgi:hypothetical protein
LVVLLSRVARDAVIAVVKLRFCGKVFVETRISPACDCPAAVTAVQGNKVLDVGGD